MQFECKIVCSDLQHLPFATGLVRKDVMPQYAGPGDVPVTHIVKTVAALALLLHKQPKGATCVCHVGR